MKELYFGDNLDVMKKMHTQHPQGFIDLIYIDPPFNSKRNYNVLFESIDMTDTKAQKEAFSDTWSSVSYHDTLNEIQILNLDVYKFITALDSIRISKSALSYLTIMAIRIIYMHKLLKNTGSFYLHCDPTMSHYLKILCDLVFGEKNFRNEIIWSYQRWTGATNQYQSMHDVILFYQKSKKEGKFNTQYETYSNKSKHKSKRFSKFVDGKISQIYTEDFTRSKAMRDVWEISYLNSQAKERLGYPTQKPLALMERIIQASSNEGDVVADFFCGCGTTIAAAEKLNRNWIGTDISHLSIKLILKRLTDPYKEERKQKLAEITVYGLPKDIASAKELASNTDKHRVQFQDWVIEFMMGGVSNQKKSGDGGYDGYITYSKSVDGKTRGVAIIEVKSGNVGVANLRSFMNVVEKEKADIGIFVCFKEQVTKGMEIEASKAGKDSTLSVKKIQILTIEDLLMGVQPSFALGSKSMVFEQSNTKLEVSDNQMNLKI